MQLDAAILSSERADRFEARAKRSTRRVIRKIIGIALFLASCMWWFIGWSLWSEYTVARATGRTQAHNLIAAFASEVGLTLDVVSSELRRIEADLRLQPRGATNTPLWDRLRRIAADNPGTDLRITGPDGHLLFSTQDPDPGPASVASSEPFITHRDNPAAGLTIEASVSASGQPRIRISCRLQAADGQFAGQAMLLMPPAKLIRLNRDIDIGRHGVIMIVGEDGLVRAGFNADHPDGDVGIGLDLRASPYPLRLDPGATATFSRSSQYDHVERLVTLRSLENYPVRVVVALDMADVLGVARAHIWFICLVGVAATVLIGSLTVLLAREVWRRTKREIELAYDRDRLRSAQLQIVADQTRLDRIDRELTTSKQVADAANRARSQFLAHMSHELRTPLHAIIGFSELIKDQAPTSPGSPPLGEYANDIWASGRHLLELINTVLDISKVESGTATLAEDIFPIAEAINHSVVSVRTQAEARGIAIKLNMPTTAICLRADRTRMTQVLINLLSNAIKFSLDNSDITLSASLDDDGRMVLCIHDTGIGMTESEVGIALEPFGQVDNALSRSFEGTGLGLPLALKLTEMHGGQLLITSAKGRGTTVRVVLPAARVATTERAVL